MPRLMRTDEHWSQLRAILLEDRLYDKPEHRITMEDILFRMQVALIGAYLNHLAYKLRFSNAFLLWEHKKILQ